MAFGSLPLASLQPKDVGTGRVCIWIFRQSMFVSERRHPHAEPHGPSSSIASKLNRCVTPTASTSPTCSYRLYPAAYACGAALTSKYCGSLKGKAFPKTSKTAIQLLIMEGDYFCGVVDIPTSVHILARPDVGALSHASQDTFPHSLADMGEGQLMSPRPGQGISSHPKAVHVDGRSLW